MGWPRATRLSVWQGAAAAWKGGGVRERERGGGGGLRRGRERR